MEAASASIAARAAAPASRYTASTRWSIPLCVRQWQERLCTLLDQDTATLQTSGGTVVIHCAVAASASDINMSNGLTVNAGDTVSCSSLTYTALSA